MINYKKLFIGSVCNNQCVTCPNTGERVGRSLEDILPEMGEPEGAIDSLELYGGEPAMRNDLTTIVAQATERGWRRIKMLTNARALADPRVVDAILASGIRIFEVKVLGHAPQLHDALTGVKGSFIQTVQGLANLRATQPADGVTPFVSLRVPIAEANHQYLPGIAGFAVRLPANRLTFEFADTALQMSAAVGFIKAAIDVGLANSVWAQTEGIPLCLMSGYEHHVSEAFAGAVAASERRDTCKACCYATCEGIPLAYLAAKGAGEFVAAIDSLYAAQMAGDG